MRISQARLPGNCEEHTLRCGGRYRFALGAITAVGLVVRVVYVLAFERSASLSIDGTYFHNAANLLANGKGFNNPYGFFWTLGTLHSPAAAHPPGYIVALSLPSAFGWDSVLAHQLWSCVLGTATVLVVGLTARLIAGERASLLAAGIAAVYPNLWVNDALVMSETLTILTVALMLYACYAFLRSRTPLDAALFGLTIALFALSRGEGILALPLLVIGSLFLLRDMAWRRRVTLLAIVVACATVAVLPWIVYNNLRFERPVLISTNLGPTALEANCDAVYHGELLGYWSQTCLPRDLTGDESQVDSKLRTRAWDYARHHLSEVPWVITKRLGRTFAFFRPTQQLRFDKMETHRPLPAATAGLVMYYLLVPFALVGAIVLRRRRVTIFPLLAVVAVVVVAVTLTFGETRYRATAEVPLVLLAACGLDALLTRAYHTDADRIVIPFTALPEHAREPQAFVPRS